MAKTMDTVVRDMLGAQQLQIAALQIQVDDLTEQLTIAKQAKEPKAPLPFDPRSDHGGIGYAPETAEGNR